MTLALTPVYTRTLMLTLVRMPGYSLPVLFFPVLLYAIFGASTADDPAIARLFLGSWSVFAVLGIALFQFGVSVSQARMSPWEGFLRTLPTGPAPRFAAQIIVALLFTAVAGALVWIAALLLTDIQMPAARWLLLAASMLAAAIPFSLIGITIGYWASPRAAVPLANLAYLVLAAMGGLWIPVGHLPDWIATLSYLLPTRHSAELAWAATQARPLPPASAAWLGAYTLVFAYLARLGWQRDQMKRYG